MRSLLLTLSCAAVTICVGLAVAAPIIPTETKSPIPSASKPTDKHLWNFHDADIRAVTQIVSELTGKTMIIDPRVTGKITLVAQEPMTVDGLFSSYLAMLQVLNYAAIPTGNNALKIIPSADAKEYVGSLYNSQSSTADDTMELKLIQLHNTAATSMLSVLRPLMHHSGYLSAYAPSNSLIVSGTHNNITHIEQMIGAMDNANNYQINILKLHYASAKKLATIIDAMQAKNSRYGNRSSYSVTADPGSNSLLVSGGAAQQYKIKKLVTQLDTSQINGSADTMVIKLNYLDAKTFAPLLEKMGSSNHSDNKKESGADTLSVQAELENNALIIHAPSALMNTLKSTTRKLDQRPQQVMIEAVVVNMNESLVKNLGIDWSFNLSPLPVSPSASSIGILHSGDLSAVITALESSGNSNILATPSILVLNNKKATISSGENIALSQGNLTTPGASSDSGSPFYQNGVYNNVERKDITLSLEVTPHIAPNSTIRLHIDHQDDSLPNGGAGSTGNLNQSYLTNKISTDVLVSSGDILVLGGLSQDSLSKTLKKIPFLGDIPLLGKLFQHEVDEMQRKNLMIFIKPVILKDQPSSRHLTMQHYQNVRAKELSAKSGAHIDMNKADLVLPAWQHKPRDKHTRAGQLPTPGSQLSSER